MLKTHSREKLVDAIVFFASNTKNCGKTKLFKLLYLLDFEHFRQTGRSVTDQDYLAWERGPIPASLEDEWDDKADDMKGAFSIKIEKVIDHEQQTIVPSREFNPEHFSKREIEIMRRLGKQYERHSAKDMVNVVHVEGGPWKRIWGNGEGRNRPIPYELAVGGKDSEAILEVAREYETLKGRYAAA
jgi:uncharacterized phage-associated protein